MLLTALGLRKPENNDGFGQDDFNLNADLLDALLRAAGLATSGLVPACRVTHSVAQSIAHNTVTALVFDTERFDTDTIHDPAVNNSRLTCKTAGKYLVYGNVGYAANATGERQLRISLNGVTLHGGAQLTPVSGNNTSVVVLAIVELAVNDYVQLEAYHTAGVALNVIQNTASTPEFGMTRIG